MKLVITGSNLTRGTLNPMMLEYPMLRKKIFMKSHSDFTKYLDPKAEIEPLHLTNPPG